LTTEDAEDTELILLGFWRQCSARPEDVAIFAVTQIEFVADDGPIHGMGAIHQLAVDDGMGPQVVGQVGRAAGVPATPMAFFGVHGS
jgi:hypothetical protein